MLVRRIVLMILLVALGLAAVAGVGALFVDSSDLGWLAFWFAAVTAATALLALPLTLMTERPKLRLSGIVAMVVAASLWLFIIGLIVIAWNRMGRYVWEETLFLGIGFTCLMGIPSALVALIGPYPWGKRAARYFLFFAAISWGICNLGAALFVVFFAPGRGSYDWQVPESFMMSGMMLYAMGAVISMLHVNSERKNNRYLRWFGIGCAWSAWLLTVFLMWRRLPDVLIAESIAEQLYQANVCLIVSAIVAAQIHLLSLAQLRRSQQILKYMAMGVWLLAGLSAIAVTFIAAGNSIFMEDIIRWPIAIGILAVCGSVGMLVLSILDRKPAALLSPGALLAKDITIICPRCEARQTIPMGEGVCGKCELKLFISAVEPRCPACQYLLYGNTSGVCPECGHQIKRAEPPMTQELVADMQ